jgi:hypothetical protein
LTGDVNVTGHLALGSVADSDVVITNDSSEREITGSGLLESGRLMNDVPSLTGMTGNPTLGSTTIFPAGHVLQTLYQQSATSGQTTSGTSFQDLNFGNGLLKVTLTTKGANSKFIFITTATSIGNTTESMHLAWSYNDGSLDADVGATNLVHNEKLSSGDSFSNGTAIYEYTSSTPKGTTGVTVQARVKAEAGAIIMQQDSTSLLVMEVAT